MKTLLTLAEDVPTPVRYEVHPMIAWAEVVILAFFTALGLMPVVTCAKNGQHSALSRHFWKEGDPRPAQAIDIRIWSIKDRAAFFRRLVLLLNRLVPEGYFIVFLEKSHAHLEWNPTGVPANLKSFRDGQYFYAVLG